MKKQETMFRSTRTKIRVSILFSVVLSALCSVPTMESSFFLRGAGTAFQALRNNKMNTFIAGLCTYPIITENINNAKIEVLAQELVNTQTNLTQAQTTIAQLQNNSVSKTTFYMVAATLGFGCYIAIRAAYNNMLLHRPQINAIVQSASNVTDAIAQLKKYDYKKQDFVAAKATLPNKFTAAQIVAIEAQLS